MNFLHDSLYKVSYNSRFYLSNEMYTAIIFPYLGSIVTQSLKKQRTDFQVAMSNFFKGKQFGVTTTYDEFLLFKGLSVCA